MKKIIYTKAPKDVEKALKNAEIVADFLPSPEELIKKEHKIKVTIALNQNSVTFFKNQAKKLNVKYQTMINAVLDRYVAAFRK